MEHMEQMNSAQRAIEQRRASLQEATMQSVEASERLSQVQEPLLRMARSYSAEMIDKSIEH